MYIRLKKWSCLGESKKYVVKLLFIFEYLGGIGVIRRSDVTSVYGYKKFIYKVINHINYNIIIRRVFIPYFAYYFISKLY